MIGILIYLFVSYVLMVIYCAFSGDDFQSNQTLFFAAPLIPIAALAFLFVLVVFSVVDVTRRSFRWLTSSNPMEPPC